MPKNPKRLATLLIAISLGFLGLHRFINEYWITGMIWLCTGGIMGIGWLIDIVMIILDVELLFRV